MIYNGYCFLYTENNTERSWRLSFQQTQLTDYTMNTVALITPLLELPLRILFLSWIELVSNVYFNIYKKFMVSRKESPGHCPDSIKWKNKSKNKEQHKNVQKWWNSEGWAPLFNEKSKWLSPKSQCSQLPCHATLIERATKISQCYKNTKKAHTHLYTDFPWLLVGLWHNKLQHNTEVKNIQTTPNLPNITA